MDSPRLKAYPSSDISPRYYFLILFPNSYLLLSAAGSFLSPLMPSKNSKLWFSFECLSWRPKARKSILCPFPSLIPMQISAESAEMLKRCKITASPPSPGAKPMWFRKAPECLHRQILKKYFPLKHNPAAHPPPCPLTLDSLSLTARQLSASFTASWPEPKFRIWHSMAGAHPAEGTRCSRSPTAHLPSELSSCWAGARAGAGALSGVSSRSASIPGCCRDGEGMWAEPWELLPISVLAPCSKTPSNSETQLPWEAPGCFCACQGWWTRHGDMALVCNVRLPRQFLGMWMNLLGADDKLLGVSYFLPYGSSSEDEASRLLLAFLSLMSQNAARSCPALQCGHVQRCQSCLLLWERRPSQKCSPSRGQVCADLSSLPLLHSLLLWAQGGWQWLWSPVPEWPGLWSTVPPPHSLSKQNLIQLGVVFLE